MKKPTSDKELLEYQKEVCNYCKKQFPLHRRQFENGCELVDFGILQYDFMINDKGACKYFIEKNKLANAINKGA